MFPGWQMLSELLLVVAVVINLAQPRSSSRGQASNTPLSAIKAVQSTNR